MERSFTVGPGVRRGGPEPGRIGIPFEIAWNESSHSILNEFMHAEYGYFVYTIWPIFGAAPHRAGIRWWHSVRKLHSIT